VNLLEEEGAGKARIKQLFLSGIENIQKKFMGDDS